MISHTPEFREPPKDKKAVTQDVAACFARLFSSDDGKRVITLLRRKFGVERPRFTPNKSGVFDPLAAAITDGESGVMLFIEGAISMGAPGKGLPQLTK